jgi:hypothetical protein
VITLEVVEHLVEILVPVHFAQMDEPDGHVKGEHVWLHHSTFNLSQVRTQIHFRQPQTLVVPQRNKHRPHVLVQVEVRMVVLLQKGLNLLAFLEIITRNTDVKVTFTTFYHFLDFTFKLRHKLPITLCESFI